MNPRKFKFINLTPHTVRIIHNEEVIEIPPSGTVARVDTIRKQTGTINNIPVYSVRYTSINLPDPELYTFYIVSSLVQQYAPWRKDLVSPDTSPDSVVRDGDGNIVAVRGLMRLGDAS